MYEATYYLVNDRGDVVVSWTQDFCRQFPRPHEEFLCLSHVVHEVEDRRLT